MANQGSNIPPDMLESMRDVFDKHTKVTYRRLVFMVIKQEKEDQKILAFTPQRMLILSAKVPTKIEQSFHFLDIQGIESKKQNQLIITVSSKSSQDDDGKSYKFRTLESESEETDHMITQIGTGIKSIFPMVPLEKIIRKIDVTPSDRIRPMNDMMKDLSKKDPGPCGGYSTIYRSMCDYHNLPFRDDVAWDVDTIYLSQDSKELRLGDFDHLDSRDLVPIISALEHNNWFTSLNSSGVKLALDVQESLLRVLKKNSFLEELHLSNTGIKWEFAKQLATALLSNSSCCINTLDLSNNYIEDRGVQHLSGAVSKLPKGLVYLNLSKTGLTVKGVKVLGDALANNKNIGVSLKELSLADNSFKGEEPSTLFGFLAMPNTIQKLDLSGTDCALDLVCTALERGCVHNLSHLNLARNPFTHKRTKDFMIPHTWKGLFAYLMAAEYINLSGCKLPPEAVKDLLLGIASNKHIKNLELDLSSNEFKTTGANMIGSCIATIRNITRLDLSDNGFDSDLKSLLGWVSQNRYIKHIALGRNFQNVKPKNLEDVLNSVVELIQEDNSPLESISLADSKLKTETTVFINALGSNSTLRSIDISGNNMGDVGARMLSKALQINTKLHTIYWDKNNTTAQGFDDVAAGLQRNYTVKKMPTPIIDAAKCQSERAQVALEKIESLLQRNHCPRKFASDQAYRLQQGFLISATQQMVDRLVVQVQDTVNALERNPQDDMKEDIERAVNCIKDADTSKQLLPRLQEIAFESEKEGGTIQKKLNEISQNLSDVLHDQLQENLGEMVTCAEKQCPTVLSDKNLKAEIETTCGEKVLFPPISPEALLWSKSGRML